MPSNRWQEYLDFGWRLVELRPGSKAPRWDKWQKEGAAFDTAALGAGLVHQWSGTCSIDIDDMAAAAPWLAAKGVDLQELFADPASVQLIGNPLNHGKLLYRLPEARRSKKVIEFKRNIIDFRCIGNQDVLPPTIHPDTHEPYLWIYGDEALGHWSQLPLLPASLDAIWAAMIGPATLAPAEDAGPAPGISLAALNAWLETKDPDSDREAWIKVGMQVHTATSGQGFYLWDNWSRKGDKYKGGMDLQSPWAGFRANGGLGVGSILSEKVAKPEDFDIEEPSEFQAGPEPSDMSAGAVAHRLLQPRLVYLTGQDRYYFLPQVPGIANLDRHGDTGLTRAGVNALFTAHMPRVVNPKSGAVSKRRPVDFLEEDTADKQVAGNLGFHPGADRLYTDADGRDYLNRYIREVVQPLAPTIREIEIWDALWDRIADADYRRWLKQFYTFILRNPGVKVSSAPLLFSQKQGTGKTTLMQIIPRLLYGERYVTVATNDLLQARFTGFLADTWFVVLDEMKGDHGKLDRIHLANKLKPWITDALLPIERKGLDMYQVPNRLQITATSNFDDAMQIDNEDRRWGVCEMGGDQMGEHEARELYDMLTGPRGRGVVRWFFDQVGLVGFDPKGKPPHTAGRLTMVRSSLGAWETNVVQAIANGTAPFDRDLVTVDAVRDFLRGATTPTARQVGSLLRKPPINCDEIRSDTTRHLCWRNLDIWQRMAPRLRATYFETGERPEGQKWDMSIPVAIRTMAGDDAPLDDLSDLMGSCNG